jgi:nondiscriminating glutamyl-tRNA synthetase
MSDVRVRFAPSPTGFLHIGGARTALLNWLYARHHAGSFVLRIEDTDRARSTTEYLEAILEDLSWLGLDWDEGPEIGGTYGPYLQSERSETYGPHVERLLQTGRAYHCFCTPEELEERRTRARESEGGWIYDRKCLGLSERERDRLLSEGRPFVIRFRVPEGKTTFDDLVLGTIRFDNAELDDLVIVRQDGSPTYNFAVVVDDIEMAITHVIRGADHISNTPRQIVIWEALERTPPRFGHQPLVLAPDGQVMSKRRGAVAIGEYRRRGYVPEAVVNYMALLGWSYGDDREFFTLEELERDFDIGRVSRKPAIFDPDKLDWMNEQWIKRLSVRDRTDRLVPFLKAEGLLEGEPDEMARKRLEKIVALLDDRVKLLTDIGDLAGFFLARDIVYDNIAVSKVLAKPGAGEILVGLHRVLSGCADFRPETLESAIRRYAEEKGLSLGKIAQPLRVALTGRTASPGIFETLSLLGKDIALSRIQQAREMAG